MDGSLTPRPTLVGTLATIPTITGTLATIPTITGNLTIPAYVDVDIYDGAYEVDPDFVGTTLPTQNKTLTNDIVVKPIRVDRVSNPSGGITVYIGA